MRRISFLRRALHIGLLLSLFFAVPASANYGIIQGTVNTVGGQLTPLFNAPSTCTGNACGFIGIALAILTRFRPLLTTMGLLVLSITGVRMLVAQEDESLGNARKVASALVAGLVLVWLIEPFVRAFYGARGEIARGQMQTGAGIINTEVSGLINWALVIVASLAVMIIILDAFKALGQGEEGITGIRKTIMSVAAGIFLLIFRNVIGPRFVDTTGNPTPAFIVPILSAINFVIGFFAFIAVLIVIYAGVQMVLTLGKEETAQKAKALLGRAVVAFVLLFVSLAIIRFVIIPGVE